MRCGGGGGRRIFRGLRGTNKTLDNSTFAQGLFPLSPREKRVDRRLPTSGQGEGELRETHLSIGPLPKPPIDEKLLEFARRMRHFSTDAERRLWRVLRNRNLGGFKFRRQVPMGNYIIDFYCLEAKVVVEADGGQHSEPSHVTYDNKRTAFLKSQGVHVMRFWDHDVLRDTEVVREMVYRVCDERRSLVIPPHPNPLPKGEGVNAGPPSNSSLTPTAIP